MLIPTIYGDQDDSCLEKSQGNDDLPDQTQSWVEYRNCIGELVHRSVHVTKKAGSVSGIVPGSFN